jgi:RimJ/RimL family protein N-acetyltransferase
MIYELNENEYYKVRPLIKGIQDMNICLNGIIDGNNQGKIWVDNLDEPKVAIVWAIGCTYFIIGDIENEGFNNSLDSYITNVIGPDCLNTYGGTHFVVTLHEDKWEDKLDNIFNHRNPYKQYEYCYIFNENMYKELTKVQDNLPYGYTVKRIEKDIISNCFSGYVSGNLCEIVIRTYEEENERKGFGTFVARTFIDYCISNRIIPHWSTTEDNIGSTSIAEKCGFEIYKKFITYCFPFMKKQK